MSRIILVALLAALPLTALAQTGSGKAPADMPWEVALKKTLADKKVTLSFAGTPLPDVLSFISQVAQVSLVLDPASKLAAETITLEVQQASISTVLNLMLALKKGEYVLRCGVVVIAAKGKGSLWPRSPPPRPKAEGGNPDHLKAYDLLKRKVTLDFSETPMTDVVQFLSETTGSKIGLDAKLKDKKVDIRIDRLSVANALTLIAHAVGGKLVFEDGAWKVIAPQPKEGGSDAAKGDEAKEDEAKEDEAKEDEAKEDEAKK